MRYILFGTIPTEIALALKKYMEGIENAKGTPYEIHKSYGELLNYVVPHTMPDHLSLGIKESKRNFDSWLQQARHLKNEKTPPGK